MQRPNPGELLRGLRKSLAEQVLPALPKGVPHQQMKAALHLLGRLERSWDLVAGHLAADNADIAAVLAQILPADGSTTLDQHLADATTPAPDGYNDADLREAARRNLALHELLIAQPHNPSIAALYRRMTVRDLRLVGDSDGQGNPQ